MLMENWKRMNAQTTQIIVIIMFTLHSARHYSLLNLLLRQSIDITFILTLYGLSGVLRSKISTNVAGCWFPLVWFSFSFLFYFSSTILIICSLVRVDSFGFLCRLKNHWISNNLIFLVVFFFFFWSTHNYTQSITDFWYFRCFFFLLSSSLKGLKFAIRFILKTNEWTKKKMNSKQKLNWKIDEFSN